MVVGTWVQISKSVVGFGCAFINQMTTSYEADNSALIRMKVQGGHTPDEDIVKWRLFDPERILEPGKKDGLYEALDKIVSNQPVLLVPI